MKLPYIFLGSMLIISSTLFAEVIIPNPKIPLSKEDSLEFTKMQQSNDKKKFRALILKQSEAYFDQFVKEYKELNNTNEPPFDLQIERNKLPLAINLLSDEQISQNDVYLLELEKKHLIKSMAEAEENKKNFSAIYILGVTIASLSVFAYSKLKNKKV